MGKPVNISERLSDYFYKKNPSNDEVLKCLNECAEYLELKKVSEFAKIKGVSVQNVYQNYNTVKVLGSQFVINNN